MTKLEALKDLAAKVEAGEWINRRTATRAARFDDGTLIDAVRAYNGSLDAAKALHEAVLPGWLWSAVQGTISATWSVFSKEEGLRRDAAGPTPARAWLLAILRALIAQEENK